MPRFIAARVPRFCSPFRFPCACLIAAYGATLLALPFPCAAPARADDKAAKVLLNTPFEPQALLLLKKMAEAYARLPALQQETEFYAAIVPARPAGAPPPPDETVQDEKARREAELGAPNRNMRLRLLFLRPNRLRMEMQQISPTTGKPSVTQWISDGKHFWSYYEDKNRYTKDNAPRHARDFTRLQNLNSGSLELLMLIGIDPFENLHEKVDSVRLSGTATVRDVETEVVTLRVVEPSRVTESRFYIGKQDFLLRRLVTDTLPLAEATSPARTGDPLDRLLDDAAPAPAPPLPEEGETPEDSMGEGNVLPVRTRFSYENLLTPNPALRPQDFAFTIPQNALLVKPFDLQDLSNRKGIEEYIRTLQKNIRDARRKKPAKVVQ